MSTANMGSTCSPQPKTSISPPASSSRISHAASRGSGKMFNYPDLPLDKTIGSINLLSTLSGAGAGADVAHTLPPRVSSDSSGEKGGKKEKDKKGKGQTDGEKGGKKDTKDKNPKDKKEKGQKEKEKPKPKKTTGKRKKKGWGRGGGWCTRHRDLSNYWEVWRWWERWWKRQWWEPRFRSKQACAQRLAGSCYQEAGY